ncbi:MAG: LysM peptidoglycan-binding domain-containing protein [Candidatus Obscuribacterales bacterium]|jgi:LysM repeat protein|nr:LysM peptidoglycan-binding domain-containing protein [Candidatus Obscuribacterales bacterium]
MSVQETSFEKQENIQVQSDNRSEEALSQAQDGMRDLSQQGKLSDLDKGKTSSMPAEFGGFELTDGSKLLQDMGSKLNEVKDQIKEAASKAVDLGSKFGEAVVCKATATPIEAPKEEAPNKAADDYKGEAGIKRDVPLETHTVKNGDTLESIARKHLGPDASVAEVAAHAKEIAKVNGVENPRMLHAGDKLQVPGHTKDGGFITKDEQGNKHTQWPDGSYRFEEKNGKFGVDRVPDGKGGYYEQGWGKNADDNYKIARDKDGQYHMLDSDGNKRRPQYSHEEQLLKRIRERDIASEKTREKKI